MKVWKYYATLGNVSRGASGSRRPFCFNNFVWLVNSKSLTTKVPIMQTYKVVLASLAVCWFRTNIMFILTSNILKFWWNIYRFLVKIVFKMRFALCALIRVDLILLTSSKWQMGTYSRKISVFPTPLAGLPHDTTYIMHADHTSLFCCGLLWLNSAMYCSGYQISNISCHKFQKLISSCSCLCPIH